MIDSHWHFGWTLLSGGCERWILCRILPSRSSLANDSGLFASLTPVRFELTCKRTLPLFDIELITLVAHAAIILNIGSVGCRLCIKVCHIEYIYLYDYCESIICSQFSNL